MGDKGNRESEAEIARIRATTYLERGRHLFNSERFADALAAFNDAIAADPAFLRAYTGKANTLTMLGRPQEAVTVCDEVIARDPAFGLAHTTRASALHRMGKVAEALASYRRGVELTPLEPLVYYNFACFWSLEGNEAECEKYLRRALELDAKSNAKAAIDGDFARFRQREWFQEIVAFRRR